MIGSLTQFIESSSESVQQRIDTVDKVMAALNSLTINYSECGANVDDCITRCEGFKSAACFRCSDPNIHVKTIKMIESQMKNLNTPADWYKYMENTPVTSGYCEKDLNNMNAVSNQ